jgi:hypothetical protein
MRKLTGQEQEAKGITGGKIALKNISNGLIIVMTGKVL